MMSTAVGYCGCGCEIHVEYIWTDPGFAHRFFTPDQEPIEACPACGRRLDESELEFR
jgi:hypothetical protein